MKYYYLVFFIFLIASCDEKNTSHGITLDPSYFEHSCNTRGDTEQETGAEEIVLNWTPITSEVHNCHSANNLEMTLKEGERVVGSIAITSDRKDKVPPLMAGWYEARVRRVYTKQRENSNWCYYVDTRTQFKKATCK